MGFGKRPIDYEKELKQRDETIARLTARIQQLEAEIEQLKKLLAGKAESKTAKKPRFTENYSLDRLNHQQRRHKDSTGRRGQEAKQDTIEEQQNVYWPAADPDACICHRQQFAWRIVDGKAVSVCYRIYDVPGSKELPLPPGVRTSRSEFGMEIILILAFLHYWIGVSIDHAREIMQFFTGLDLSKSQADSLLSQLAADWEEQYDTIAELRTLAHRARRRYQRSPAFPYRHCRHRYFLRSPAWSFSLWSLRKEGRGSIGGCLRDGSGCRRRSAAPAGA